MWKDDSAVSDTIGSILLIGITVASFAGLSALVFAIPPPADVVHAELDIKVKPGPDRTWSTGDELVQVRHLYGESLPLAGTKFTLHVNGDSYDYEGSALGFSGDTLDLGERWSVNHLIGFNDNIEMLVYAKAGSGHSVVASSSVITGFTECSIDTTAPAAVFDQQPDNIEALLGTQSVAIHATLTDACSAIDTGVDPIIDTWFDDEPKDSNIMTPNGTNRWSWTVAAPAGGWTSNALQDFKYQARGMADVQGNVGDSPIIVDHVEPLPPTYHYVESVVPGLGAVNDFSNMQNASDGGLNSELVEAVTAGSTTNIQLYADALSLVDPAPMHHDEWKDTDRWIGNDPGDVSKFEEDDEWPANHPVRLEIEPAPALSGQVIEVKARAEVLVELDDEDDPLDDGFRLQLCWSGQQITSTSCSVKSPTLPASTEFQWLEYDFTNYRPGGGEWLVTDLDNLDIIVQIVIVGGERDGDKYHGTRVRLDATVGPGYDMDHEFQWTNNSIAPTTNNLQLKYYVNGGDFQVEVFDGATFVPRGGALTASAPTTWSVSLDANEWNNGNPTVRITSLETSPASEATVYIDYLRVTSP